MDARSGKRFNRPRQEPKASLKAAVSPDGSQYTIAFPDGSYEVYDSRWKLPKIIQGNPVYNPQVSYSHDGSFLVLNYSDLVMILDRRTLEVRHSLKLAESWDNDLTLSETAPYAVVLNTMSGNPNYLIDLISGKTKQIRKEFTPSTLHTLGEFSKSNRYFTRHLNYIDIGVQDLVTDDFFRIDLPYYMESVSFSPDESTLAIGGEYCTVVLVSLKTKKPIATKKVCDSPTSHRTAYLDYSPDGRLLAAADGNYINIMNPKTLDVLHRFEHNRVSSVKFSPDGKRIVSSSNRGWTTDVRIFNLPNRDP